MAAALQDASETTQDFQDKVVDDSEDDGSSPALEHESTRENVSTDGNNLRADSPLFAQNVRDKDRLAIFRAANRELKKQRRDSLKASLKAAVDTNAQKEAELEDIKRRGLDGSSNQVYAQLKREKTEIAMHVSDHKSERLKRTGRKMMTSNKTDSFYNSVQLASQMSKLPQLQRACWEVTNFVPLKIHGATQSAAAQASQVREVTEDPAVLKALRQLFDLLDVFSNQSEQFLAMLCKDTEVAVVTVPAGTRAATKGQPMIRSLVLLSGQAHHLSYAGESYILLEESQSTRMNTGDCLGFIDDNEECIQENAFTIACQTSCSFLEITKASFDEIYNQIKFERFMIIMSIAPEERSEKDLEFLCLFAKKNAFFKQLKESRQMNLCRQAKMEQWKFDDVLFNEDERGQIYYIIIRGSVRVLKNVGGALDNQGKKIFQQVALLGPGVGFGELALLSSAGVRQATVIANEHSVFMTLSRKTYNEVLRGEHEHSLNETIRAIVHVFPYVGQRDKIFQTYIAQLFREEELPTGHVVVNQGSKAATFYILKEGALSIDCRIEFSRFCPPTEAGFLHSEDNFETKTLKKFTEKEFKARIVPFGELSTFGDTIGDMDMLANPIWSATYMYRATASKPVVLCSISWAALKVRFPPEMLEDLQTRLLQKFALFKRIFNSAVVTECSNSKFSCLSDFHPIGYVQKTTEEKLKSSAKLSLGEQLEEKKLKLRRHVRNRMDVLPAEAFQTTVNEWIDDMSYGKVLSSIEAASDDLNVFAGIRTNALEPLLACASAKQDVALQSVMRSAFLDEENIDLCIKNIIKMTSNEIEKEASDSESTFNTCRGSQRLALKSAETRALSPNSGRTIRTPIPGHKPQIVRYDLTEQYCNVVEEPMFIVDDLILLDSSVVQTRPSSSATVFTSRSKFKQRTRSTQRPDTSVDTSADEIDNYHRVASPVYDDYNLNATTDARFKDGLNNNHDDFDFPEYFYPAHYRIKSSKTRNTKNRAMAFKKHRDPNKGARSTAPISFETTVCATPIQLKPLIGHVRMSSPRLFSEESPARCPTVHSNMPLPPFDKNVLSVRTFKNDPLRLSSSVSLQYNHSVSQAASKTIPKIVGSEKDGAEKSFLSLSDSGQDDVKIFGAYAREKESTRPTNHSEFKMFHDDSTDDEHMQGATCSPDLATSASSTMQVEIDVDQRPVSREDKLKEILKSRFTVVREQDADTQRLQAETIERLKLSHAHQEKQKSQAETKSKIANLFSTGMLNNKIKHLEENKIKHLEETTIEPIDFELSQSLLDKMNDVVIRRMNDPNFKGQKNDFKLPSGITSSAKTKNKLISAACLKSFDFDGFEPLFSGKLIKFDDVTRSSYHNEQMLKMQNRNSNQQKAERQQLLKNVLSKSNRGPSFGALHVGKAALPPVVSASPKQHR